ncbi:MAG: hypothetical protein GC200_10540 [Tepidisphaera sp.]|nr:hypothetical protein [Tepidisphaera sp.]
MASMILKHGERLALYAGVAAAIFFGVASQRDVSSVVAQPTPQVTTRIATADILAVAERLIATDKYKTGRDNLATSLNKDLQTRIDAMNSLKDQYAALPEAAKAQDSTDSKAVTLRQQFSQQQQELQQKDADARAQVEKFNTTQVIEAYKIISEAASDMATTMGYTHLIASRNGAFDIRSQNLTGAVQEMLARPVIKAPAADDLTDRLIKQFHLENVKVPTPGEVANPTPAPATDAPAMPTPVAPK